MTYRFVDEHRDQHAINLMCQLLCIVLAGFYARLFVAERGSFVGPTRGKVLMEIESPQGAVEEVRGEFEL